MFGKISQFLDLAWIRRGRSRSEVAGRAPVDQHRGHDDDQDEMQIAARPPGAPCGGRDFRDGKQALPLLQIIKTFEKWLRRGSEIFFASEWVTYKPYSLPSVKFNHATAKNI